MTIQISTAEFDYLRQVVFAHEKTTTGKEPDATVLTGIMHALYLAVPNNPKEAAYLQTHSTATPYEKMPPAPEIPPHRSVADARDLVDKITGCLFRGSNLSLRSCHELAVRIYRCLVEPNAERQPPRTTNDMNMQETNQQPEGGADVRSSVWLVCDDCHCKGADVEETTCPYSEEIKKKVVPATLCKKCYHERCRYI